ncbi:MAG: hypothetical protein AB7N70_36035 [Dehalococcoidia bacterium]
MAERNHPRVRAGTRCEIVVRGELDARYASAFDEMTSHVEGGNTHIIGNVIDQAQLYGLLERIASLGIELISLNSIPEDGACTSTDGTP